MVSVPCPGAPTTVVVPPLSRVARKTTLASAAPIARATAAMRTGVSQPLCGGGADCCDDDCCTAGAGAAGDSGGVCGGTYAGGGVAAGGGVEGGGVDGGGVDE